MRKQKHFFIFAGLLTLAWTFAASAQTNAPDALVAPEASDQAASEAPAPPSLSAQGAAAMTKRGLKNCKQAVVFFREALAQDPTSLDRKLDLADALNCVMSIRTHGNIPMIEGTNDTEPHKKIWSQMGPEALTLAEEVYQARPGDIRSLAVYTDAYMYRSSAWGIVNAVVKGAADQYVANAEKMTQKFPNYDSGLDMPSWGHSIFLLLGPCQTMKRLGKNGGGASFGS